MALLSPYQINLNVSATLTALEAKHEANLAAMRQTCDLLAALVLVSMLVSLIVCLNRGCGGGGGGDASVGGQEGSVSAYFGGVSPTPLRRPSSLRRSFGSRESFGRTDSSPRSSIYSPTCYDDTDSDGDEYETQLSSTPRESMYFRRSSRQQRLLQARRRGSMGSLGGARFSEMLALPHELRKSTTDSNLAAVMHSSFA